MPSKAPHRNFFVGHFSQKSLREIVRYDELTGVFTNAKSRSGSPKAVGQPLGSRRHANDYVRLSVNGKIFQAHRLAWFYVYGRWPSHFIDHIDGDRGNNAIANLREASDTENARNSAKTIRSKGYVYDKRCPLRPYHARIVVNYKAISLGYFASPEEAKSVYLNATRKYFGEFSATNRRSVGALQTS